MTVARNKGRSFRMGSTYDHRMLTTEALLRRSLRPRGDRLQLTLPSLFQGLPGAAHGGTVLAAFEATAALGGIRRVSGRYRKRVPLATALDLEVAHADGGVRCRLSEADTLLVEGRVEPGQLSDDPGEAVHDGSPLPVSTTCFVCGVDNTAGLQARLCFDDVAVSGRWTPPAHLRAPDGSLSAVALTALLDETSFWLGALATGESGMTTDLTVTLAAHLPFGTLAVSGQRSQVRPTAGDPRYRATHVVARDGADRVVATADITFVAVRGAARRLATWVAPLNPPEVLHRIFPAYA